MKSSKNVNVVNNHAGHRKRLRNNMEMTGLFNVSDVHFLEHLLTYTITRADTNPIAHDLLNEFGSIEQIFNASPHNLQKIKGVGDKTARFLNYMSVSAFMYNKSMLGKKPYVGTLKSLINYLRTVIPPSENEQFIVLIINKNFTVKQHKIFNGVSHSLISINANELADYLVQHKTNFCIFAHTHPHHRATPSDPDMETFKAFNGVLNALSICLVENVILGENEYFSIRHNRTFTYDEDADFKISSSRSLNEEGLPE